MALRRLLMSLALLSGCTPSTRAAPHPEATSYGGECAKEAVFVPNMNAGYEDDEGNAWPVGDRCLPCSHALGFSYANGTIYLIDPEGRVVELAPVEGAHPDPLFRIVGTRTVNEVKLPKRRKMLEALLRGGPPARADYEPLLAGMTKPKPPLKAPSSAEFVPDRDYSLTWPRASGEKIVLGVRYEVNREHVLVDAMVYVIDPEGQLHQFRLVAAGEHGICNPVERFAEIGVIAWEAVEPPERARSLREKLVTRPTPEEYATFVGMLTDPPTSLKVSIPRRVPQKVGSSGEPWRAGTGALL